jgi:methyl coenzyme M reductase subunit D
MNELETLKDVWRLIDNGNEMPDDIASQPIELVRKAVHWLRQGIVVAVAKEPTEIVAKAADVIADWDRQDDKNSNAYG